MEKRIDLENGDIVVFEVIPLNHYDMVKINKGYFENGELKKIITFSMWDDFGFEGWNILDDEVRRLDFEFDKFDPLYSHLDKLLGENSELIIDDDDTCEEMKKIMKIYKTETNITVTFENQLENLDIISKFKLFIKNIMTDYRSKIDCNGQNTKIRLINFFRGIQNEYFETNLKMISDNKIYKKV